ncbi:hypothetical protein FH972_017716 [Carpinus fangiana]|uniref:Uncharacterized protein n=1 Tax=Carpinus fangiana TaxID=176857 RepID=A0A5N6RJQ1_9ROSI|nr:hypothetical protein FH972_017716 [Carpinus fangiana]
MSVIVPEGKNQRGWNKLESELQIAVRFFQPFLLAPGNEAVKKQRSFTEVLNATVRQTKELFRPSFESLARVPRWLLGGNVDQYKLQSSKAPLIPTTLLVTLALVRHCPLAPAKMAAYEHTVPGGKNIAGAVGDIEYVKLRSSLIQLQLVIVASFPGLSVRQVLSHLELGAATAMMGDEASDLTSESLDLTSIKPDHASDPFSAGVLVFEGFTLESYFGLTKSQKWLLASLRDVVKDDAMHLALLKDMEESGR